MARELGQLIDNCSIEVPARQSAAAEECRAGLPPGMLVHISLIAGDDYHGLLNTAAQLRKDGFQPVPHLPARSMMSYTQLEDYVTRAAGCGVERLLVIGGDLDQQQGPFAGAGDVLATGLLAKHGIRGVDLAAYPEGNARLAPLDTEKLLDEKLAMARAQGLDPAITTQFGFEAAPILSWLRALRMRGEQAPVRLGLAGPANIVTLLKYGVRCGIGGSLRALHAQPDSLNRQLGQGDPVQLLTTLAAGWPAGLDQDRVTLHVYAFGGIRRTAAWLTALRGGSGSALAQAR